MSREAAEYARHAAAIIQERGICKGNLNDDAGRVCMWGAILRAKTTWTAISEIEDAIGAEMGLSPLTRWPGAADFNDLPDTDEKDVAKFLMGLADRLELS